MYQLVYGKDTELVHVSQCFEEFLDRPTRLPIVQFKKKRKVTCDKPVTVNVELLCKLCFVHCTLQYPVIVKNFFLKQNEMHNFVHSVYMQ